MIAGGARDWRDIVLCCNIFPLLYCDILPYFPTFSIVLCGNILLPLFVLCGNIILTSTLCYAAIFPYPSIVAIFSQLLHVIYDIIFPHLSIVLSGNVLQTSPLCYAILYSNIPLPIHCVMRQYSFYFSFVICCKNVQPLFCVMLQYLPPFLMCYAAIFPYLSIMLCVSIFPPLLCFHI